MKFKHKHKNHQRANSPHKSPLRKSSKSGIPEEQPQIKSPIFEFQQAAIDEEKTTVATLTTREVVQQRNEIKSPIFGSKPFALKIELGQRNFGSAPIS